MESWRARLTAAQQQFMEDDEQNEVEMQQAFDQLQDNIDEDVPPQRRASGSQRGKAQNIDRERVVVDERMFNDYFLDTPTFGPVHFHRWYRMRRSLFLTIMERVCARDRYFVQRPDACGLVGLSSRQKITTMLRMVLCLPWVYV
jgi:hypothetical protein